MFSLPVGRRVKVVTELSDSEIYFILNAFFSCGGNKTKHGHLIWRELPTFFGGNYLHFSPFCVTYIGQPIATGINDKESSLGV